MSWSSRRGRPIYKTMYGLALPHTTVCVRWTEKARCLAIAVDIWHDDVKLAPERKTLEIWFPEFALFTESHTQRVCVQTSFLQKKEEELANNLQAKRVGIVVEGESSASVPSY